MALLDDLRPTVNPEGEHACRYCVHGHHLVAQRYKSAMIVL